MRDHTWLQKQLDELLKNYFAEMPVTNPIQIRWGRETKFRFGSIKLEGKSRRYIRLRGLGGFLNRKIELQEDSKGETPKKSIITVKKLFRHPHHGGVVNAEIEKRGGKHLVTAYKQWLKEYRKKILAGRTKI